MKLNSAIVILIVGFASQALALGYIDSSVLGHLAIPAILAGSGYSLIGLGKSLSHGHHGGHYGHHGGYHSHGVVHHIHGHGHGYGGYGLW